MSEAISALPFPVVSTRKSLKDELIDRGIPVIPKSEVRQHKRAYVRKMRPGGWRFAAPALTAIINLLRLTSFEIFTEIGSQKESKEDKRLGIWFGSVLALGIYSLAAGWMPGVIPAASMVLLLCLICNETIDERIGGWTRVKFASFCQKGTIPTRIQDRIADVEGIEGTTVQIDLYETDPLVLVRRGPWYWKEAEYFGAWDTGNPKLDSY